MVEPSGTALRSTRAFWLKHLHRWHWISAAVSLAGLLMFAITGFTLNHAADIQAQASVRTRQSVLPKDLREALSDAAGQDTPHLPSAVSSWFQSQLQVDLTAGIAEWSEDELYVALPRPGRDAWTSIELASGAVLIENTDRGWISYFNDLHKGRHAGRAWFWFIDLFALACAVFALTGLLLLQLHASRRPSTWPIVGLGLLLPVLLLILFVH